MAIGGFARPAVQDAPHEVAAVLHPLVEALADDVLAALVDAVPPFREWFEGSPNIRQGVEQGLRGFVELVESGDRASLPGRELYFDFGRGELRAGRSLDAVMTAYRVGAQAAWRGMADAGDAAGLDPRSLYSLAELIFSYVERISAATVEGYAYEQSVREGERHDERRRLVEVLLQAPAAPAAELARIATSAGWRVARTLSFVAFGDERVARMAARLPADAVVARVGRLGYAVVPDPDAPGRHAAIAAALRNVRAALGPVVEPEAAAESARLARLALTLCDLDGPPHLIVADEHRVDLLLLQDRALAARLVEDVLGPLEELGPASRDRLLETLTAWLGHQGEVRPTAAELHVHAQTVRYRLAQLRELVGDRMATHDGRLELGLALRARRSPGAAAALRAATPGP